MSSSSAVPSTENNRPLILSPQFRDILIKSINLLPPDDFLRLAATSKDMRDVCYQSPGVSVRYSLDIHVNEEGTVPKFNFIQNFGKQKWLLWAQMRNIMDLPFRFEVYGVFYKNRLVPVNDAMVAATRYFLIALGVKRIEMLFVQAFICDWNELVPLAKDYRPAEVLANFDVMSDELLKELMGMKLRDFSYQRTNAADEDIMRCNIRKLMVRATFSKETVEEIIKRWLSKNLEIGEWRVLSSSLAPSDMSSVFRRFPSLYCDQYEGRLLEIRPIVIVKEEEGKDYYFLVREDNKVLNVFQRDDTVELVTELNFSHHPDILEPLHYEEF